MVRGVLYPIRATTTLSRVDSYNTKMKCRLLQIFAAISLLILVALAVAWPVSYGRRVLTSRSTGYSVMALNLSYGQLVVEHFGAFKSAAPTIYNWSLETPA